MKLSTEVIYDFLSEKYSLRRYGLKAKKRELLLPVFYNPQTQERKGAIYIARTEDLVRKPMEDCLFFCVGPKPPEMWNMWPCEIIHVQDSQNNIFAVFNALQRIFGRLIDWTENMQELAASGADVRSLVEKSIPLFGNRITVTDYDLNILAYCQLTEDANGPHIAMSNKFQRVPIEKASKMAADMRKSMQNREPFYSHEEGFPDSYCINMFVGNDYIGCCALQEELRPLRRGDLELFEEFSKYVIQTLSIQANSPGGQLITIRAVFEQMLRRYPVSQYDVERALELAGLNLENGNTLKDFYWYYIVIRSANSERAYPEQYLCRTVEDLVERSNAFVMDDAIVVFALTPDEASIEEALDVLDEYLADMNFIAGVSRPFRNIFDSYGYYQQAYAALQIGMGKLDEKRRFMFSEHALDFMLEHCCGDFEQKMVIDPSLIALAHSTTGGVDYLGTLRAYLDNNCNASQTAKEMFLHRSTLVQRLEHIEKYVNLSTSDQQLYLRTCLHLPDIDSILAASKPI